MTIKRRVYLVIGLAMLSVGSMAQNAAAIVVDNLEVSATVFTNTICPNLPVVIIFKVKNVSSKSVQVLRPCLSSMDVVDEARASVVTSISSPAGDREQVRYSKPYIGPLKEIESVRINPVTLASQECLVAQLIIGGSWRQGQEHTIFAQEGQYLVALTYYPNAVISASGGQQIDRTRSIEVPELSIVVTSGNAADAAVWQQIQKLKNWWILFDPEMRNVEYLSLPEQQELADELAIMAQDHGKSVYYKYLEYGAAALQLVHARGMGTTTPDAIQKLDSLANDWSYAYRPFAQEIRNRVNK